MATMVTGIGHAGSYVVRDLLAAGEDVVLFGLFGGPGGAPDAPTPDLEILAHIVGDDYAQRVTTVVGDIRDLDLMLDTARSNGVTKIVHMASMLSSAVEANPPMAIQVNALGACNVFETAKQLNMEKVVWASSMDVFGHGDEYEGQVIDDDYAYDPPWLYGATKVFTEYLARQYARNHGLSITGLRLARIYGYGEHIKATRGSGTSWLSSLLHDPALGTDAEVVVPFGARSMDFVYIEDVSRSVLRALEHTEPGSRDYLIVGDFRPIQDAYSFVKSLFPEAPISLQLEDAELPPGSSMTWALPHSGRRATDEIGYTAEVALEEGLLRTMNANRAAAGLPPIDAPA